jgi:cysteine desulfurase/selenocysteine lyase
VEIIVAGEKWSEEIREDFPVLKLHRNGKPPIYFDNACTTLVPEPVVKTINEYYSRFPACGGGRSRYWFTEEIANRIEGNANKGAKGSRQIIKEFINARSDKEIIFTLNASHAINTVALGFKFKPGDIVLLTDKEHNSNLVPWLRLQNMGFIKVDYVEPSRDDTFDLEKLKQKLESKRVRLVSMAYTSNLTGYTIPAREIVSLAHRYGARVLLDGAQTLPHQSIDVQKLDVDFLAFSLHKMCGPRGVGVLYGKQDLLGQRPDNADAIEPVITGGGTVRDTTYNAYNLLETPERFEVGNQNYPGLIAAGTAIQYLQKIGMDKIQKQNLLLNDFLTKELINRYGDTGWFYILGPADASRRSGILTFEVKRPNAIGIAEELDARNNIMIRDGALCVHAYLNRVLGQGWTLPKLPSEHRMVYRVSLYFYNTIEECRIFLDTIDEIFKERSYI